MIKNTENESKDCLTCRLVSGFGVIGIACYIYIQAKNRQKLEMYSMRAISAGAFGIGIARLLNLKFLKANKDS